VFQKGFFPKGVKEPSMFLFSFRELSKVSPFKTWKTTFKGEQCWCLISFFFSLVDIFSICYYLSCCYIQWLWRGCRWTEKGILTNLFPLLPLGSSLVNSKKYLHIMKNGAAVTNQFTNIQSSSISQFSKFISSLLLANSRSEKRLNIERNEIWLK